MAKDYLFYLQYMYIHINSQMHQAHKIHLSNFLSGMDLVFGKKIETTSRALLDVKLPNDPVVGLS